MFHSFKARAILVINSSRKLLDKFELYEFSTYLVNFEGLIASVSYRSGQMMLSQRLVLQANYVRKLIYTNVDYKMLVGSLAHFPLIKNPYFKTDNFDILSIKLQSFFYMYSINLLL